MPAPNMRSVISLVNQKTSMNIHGGRSMGARRNISSCAETKGGGFRFFILPLPSLTSMVFGCCVYGYWDLANYYPKWKRSREEEKLLEQRRDKLVLELESLRRRADNK